MVPATPREQLKLPEQARARTLSTMDCLDVFLSMVPPSPRWLTSWLAGRLAGRLVGWLAGSDSVIKNICTPKTRKTD